MNDDQTIGTVFTPRETDPEPVPIGTGLEDTVEKTMPYHEESRHSWFRDRMLDSIAKQLDWNRRSAQLGEAIEASEHVSQSEVQAARERLRKHSTISAAVTTGGSSGGPFIPKGAPAYVADVFATSVKASSVLAGLLPNEELPAAGTKVETARMTTGAAVGVQSSENALTATQDIQSALATSPLATFAGHLDLSRQVLDRSSPKLDIALARELGELLGQEIDRQLMTGSGSSGQTLGLANVTGIVSNSVTGATAADNFAAFGKLIADTSTAYGAPVTHLLLHPRRYAFILHKIGYSPTWAATPTQVPAIRTNISSTQDEVFVIVRDELPVYLGDVEFSVHGTGPGFSEGTVRAGVLQYGSFLSNRKPTAIGRLTGAGLAAPTF